MSSRDNWEEFAADRTCWKVTLRRGAKELYLLGWRTNDVDEKRLRSNTQFCCATVTDLAIQILVGLATNVLAKQVIII
jgi:hypothetical protein